MKQHWMVVVMIHRMLLAKRHVLDHLLFLFIRLYHLVHPLHCH